MISTTLRQPGTDLQVVSSILKVSFKTHRSLKSPASHGHTHHPCAVPAALHCSDLKEQFCFWTCLSAFISMLSLHHSQPKTSPASPVSASPVPTTDDSNEAHTNTKEHITVRETLKGSDITAVRLYLLVCSLPSPHTWNTWALERWLSNH